MEILEWLTTPSLLWQFFTKLICVNTCQMAKGEKGYCGLRENKAGKLKTEVSPIQGFLNYYLDPPTNCCAAWFCGAPTSRKNLSVFFYGCGFDACFIKILTIN